MRKKTICISGFSPVPGLIAAAMCATFVSGCATAQYPGQKSIKDIFASNDPCSNNGRNIGIAVGALAGLVIGDQVKHSDASRIIGAAAGGAIGALIGSEMDRRRCELWKIAKQNNLEVQFEEIKASQVASPEGASEDNGANNKTVGLKMALKDNGLQFKSGSDELTLEAIGYFQQIADQYSYDAQKKLPTSTPSKGEGNSMDALKGKYILLVGHTDDTGSSALNADLSERRARAVAKVFSDRGISKEQLFYQGAGETLPVADNRTEEGRASNRRVEIVDLSDDAELRAYLGNRKPLLTYYRNTPAPSAIAAAPDTSSREIEPAQPVPRRKAAKSGSTLGGAATTTPAPTPVKSKAASAMPPAQKAAAPSQGRVAAAPVGSVQIDFGGEPVGSYPISVDIGKLSSPSGGFSIISSAHADEPLAGSCLQDRPRISNGVKSLKDGKEFATHDYLPGLYDTSWAGMANGHLVALTHVGVLRDGAMPAQRPQLLVYQDYKGDKGAKATFTSAPDVNTYHGDKGLLYRVFMNGPVNCMDIVIPNEKPTEAPASNLYYSRGETMYAATFNPKLAK